MHPLLLKRFNALEADRQKLLLTLTAFPHEALASNAPAGKWSVNQILTHLVTSEKLSLLYMQKKSLGVQQLANSGILESLKLVVLKVSQRLPLKYKAPAVLATHTPDALPLPQVIEQWDAVRNDLRNFLEGIASQDIRKMIYKHPVVGMLDVMQAMAFFHEHIHHHWPQVKSLLKN
jgi:hypothetical protein